VARGVQDLTPKPKDVVQGNEVGSQKDYQQQIENFELRVDCYTQTKAIYTKQEYDGYATYDKTVVS